MRDGAAGRAAAVSESGKHEQLSCRGLLAELLLGECDERDWRRSARRVKAASRKYPAPNPSSTRPPDRRSRLAACLATIAGERITVLSRW